MEADFYEKESLLLLKWLLKTQNDDGLWYLSSPTKTIEEICTWSTAEWVLAIDLASTKFLGYKTRILEKEKNNWNWIFIPVCLRLSRLNLLISSHF